MPSLFLNSLLSRDQKPMSVSLRTIKAKLRSPLISPENVINIDNFSATKTMGYINPNDEEKSSGDWEGNALKTFHLPWNWWCYHLRVASLHVTADERTWDRQTDKRKSMIIKLSLDLPKYAQKRRRKKKLLKKIKEKDVGFEIWNFCVLANKCRYAFRILFYTAANNACMKGRLHEMSRFLMLRNFVCQVNIFATFRLVNKQ